MQRDYWYTAARAPGDLESAERVGRMAGERTVRRLDARKLATTECPVVFEAPEAADLIGYFVGAVSGGACTANLRSCSIRWATQVFAPHVSIREEPHLPRGRGSAPFDAEGVATLPRDVVRDGVVRGYFLGSYSARKLGMHDDRQTPAAATISCSPTARTTCRRCCGGWGAACSSPSSWGRA